MNAAHKEGNTALAGHYSQKIRKVQFYFIYIYFINSITINKSIIKK